MNSSKDLAQEYKTILKQNGITIVTVFDPTKDYIEINLMQYGDTLRGERNIDENLALIDLYDYLISIEFI